MNGSPALPDSASRRLIRPDRLASAERGSCIAVGPGRASSQTSIHLNSAALGSIPTSHGQNPNATRSMLVERDLTSVSRFII
jgi:hypothetical protein